MVGCQMGTDLVAAQLALDPLGAAIIGALFGLPFCFIAYWVLLVGTLRSEHAESNWWHRAFSFYNETKVGKLVIILSLFAPAIAIFITSLMTFPTDVHSAIGFASIPWLLCPFIPLADLWASKQPPNRPASNNGGSSPSQQE